MAWPASSEPLATAVSRGKRRRATWRQGGWLWSWWRSGRPQPATHLREVGHAERVVKMPNPLDRTIERLSAEFWPSVERDEVTDVVA